MSIPLLNHITIVNLTTVAILVRIEKLCVSWRTAQDIYLKTNCVNLHLFGKLSANIVADIKVISYIYVNLLAIKNDNFRWCVSNITATRSSIPGIRPHIPDISTQVGRRYVRRDQG